MRKSIDAMGSSSYHSPAHCFDESPAGYSWVGCSPAEPTCASPAESIMPNRRSIEKRNDRNAPFHPTPLTKNCKGCPGTNCKGCLGTGHDVGLLGWTAALGCLLAQTPVRSAQISVISGEVFHCFRTSWPLFVLLLHAASRTPASLH